MASSREDPASQLRYAARDGKLEEVKKLILEDGVAIDAADRFGGQAIHEAATWGQAAVLDFLLAEGRERGLNLLEAVDREGMQPLHLAVRSDRISMVRKLCELGADPEVLNEFDEAPVDLAGRFVDKNRAEIEDFLQEKMAEKRKNRNLGFVRAAMTNDLDGTSLERLDAGFSDEDGQNALHGSAIYGNWPAMSLILLKGVRLDSANNQGVQPIHFVAMSDCVPALDYLLEKSRDKRTDIIGVADNEGRQPLHWAAMCGSMATAKRLVEKRASLSAKTLSGETAADLAQRKGHAAIAEFLTRKMEEKRLADEAELAERKAKLAASLVPKP